MDPFVAVDPSSSIAHGKDIGDTADGNDDVVVPSRKKWDITSFLSSTQSQIPTIWSQFVQQLERIDVLEKKLNAHVSRSRRRIQNVLDQIPSHRKSHLRMFITHNMDRRSGIWTLCIEGKLLIGNKDHTNATLVDDNGVLSVREAYDPKINENEVGTDSNEIQEGSIEVSTTMEAPTPASATTANTSSTPALTDRISDRNQYKVGEKEEDPIEPITFTHFFDKLEVTFRTIYQPKVVPTTVEPSPSSSSISGKKSRSTKRKSVQMLDIPAAVNPADLRTSAPTTLTWTKDTTTTNDDGTDDSHAFFVKYNNHFSERPPPPNMKFHSVGANIRLYPTRPASALNDTDAESEPVYKVSMTLSKQFFPRHSNEGGTVRDPPPSPSNKKRKTDTDSMDDDDDDDDDDNDDNSSEDHQGGTGTGGTEGLDDTSNNVIPIENEIHVPALLTYNEIAMAIFLYVQDNKLYDPTDRSLIVCDDVLADVLQTESFNFSQLYQLLIGNNLITKIGPDQEPIILTYVMNEKTTSPQTPLGYIDKDNNDDQQRVSVAQQLPPPPPVDPDHHPTVLSFDMDVAFPSLFNYRSRELLRRIKKREFEYTSSRTKARYLLVASKGNEDIIKTKIEQCISGQGYVEENIPIFLALAKAATPNSEAQVAAQIDARTCDLVGRLDECSRMASTAWGAVDALQLGMGLADIDATTSTTMGRYDDNDDDDEYESAYG